MLYNIFMKLKNNFPEDTRLLFLYVTSCFDCGRCDQGLELHHITGRDSNDPTNAFPICRICHSKVKHNDEEHERYKKITKAFLEKEAKHNF